MLILHFCCSFSWWLKLSKFATFCFINNGNKQLIGERGNQFRTLNGQHLINRQIQKYTFSDDNKCRWAGHYHPFVLLLDTRYISVVARGHWHILPASIAGFCFLLSILFVHAQFIQSEFQLPFKSEFLVTCLNNRIVSDNMLWQLSPRQYHELLSYHLL